MDGLQFEHRCAELLRYRGFHKVAVTKGSGDQGVDILAQKNGIKYIASKILKKIKKSC